MSTAQQNRELKKNLDIEGISIRKDDEGSRISGSNGKPFTRSQRRRLSRNLGREIGSDANQVYLSEEDRLYLLCQEWEEGLEATNIMNELKRKQSM